jgi:hypothetical protein
MLAAYVPMRRIGTAQRRARLAHRHRLVAPGVTVVDAARAVVALHATDPATVFLSVAARTRTARREDVEAALYDDRSLLRMLAMRRTMFVVPAEDAPVLQAAAGDAIAVQQRKRYGQLVAGAGLGDLAWLDEVADSTARALAARGEAVAAELSADEPRLRSQVMMAEGKSYGAATNITSWVLLLLAAQGRIVRGRPRGSWLSTQWRWAPVERWLPGGMVKPAAEAARADLVRRWLAAFGPGTAADLRWWTGWTAAHVKQAVAAVGAVEVTLDEGVGLVLPDDLDDLPPPAPWVALLPGLDPTPMGWQGREWYLGPHAETLFDRTGNVGPTVWADGRIVGGWAQRASGEIVFKLLEDVGRESGAAIEAEAARLAAWIGPDARVIPRFRTPLERTLTA